jgi:beta-lactamase regulating signal transducer with metallopeptidase domain
MMAGVNFNTIAEAVALLGGESLIIGALVTVFASIFLRVSPRQNSSVRFAIWFSALLATGVLPWLAGALGLGFGTRGQMGQMAATRSAITVPGSWAIYLFIIWAAIAAVALARVWMSLWNLRALRRSLTPVDMSVLDAGTREILKAEGRRGTVVLCTSDRVNTPTAIGLVKPAVVIPSWLMTELSAAELNQILLHELAHLRRWDDWTNLAQKIVKALFFFHPAVWWIEKKLQLEREMACDDVVLAHRAHPREYAACLVRLAEKSMIRRTIALAQAAVGRISETSLRVAQILDVDRPVAARMKQKGTLAVSLVAAFAVACVAGIERAPRLIAFDEAPAPAMIASSSPSPSSLPRSAAKPQTLATAIGAASPRRIVEKTKTERQAPRMVEAKAKLQDAGVGIHSYVASDLRQPRGSQCNRASLVRTASDVRRGPAATKAMFVLVEQDEYETSGREFRGVTVWYLLLVHPPAGSGSGIPRKET